MSSVSNSQPVVSLTKLTETVSPAKVEIVDKDKQVKDDAEPNVEASGQKLVDTKTNDKEVVPPVSEDHVSHIDIKTPRPEGPTEETAEQVQDNELIGQTTTDTKVKCEKLQHKSPTEQKMTDAEVLKPCVEDVDSTPSCENREVSDSPPEQADSESKIELYGVSRNTPETGSDRQPNAPISETVDDVGMPDETSCARAASVETCAALELISDEEEPMDTTEKLPSLDTCAVATHCVEDTNGELAPGGVKETQARVRVKCEVVDQVAQSMEVVPEESPALNLETVVKSEHCPPEPVDTTIHSAHGKDCGPVAETEHIEQETVESEKKDEITFERNVCNLNTDINSCNQPIRESVSDTPCIDDIHTSENASKQKKMAVPAVAMETGETKSCEELHSVEDQANDCTTSPEEHKDGSKDSEKKLKKRHLHAQHEKERPLDGSTNPNLKKTEHRSQKDKDTENCVKTVNVVNNINVGNSVPEIKEAPTQEKSKVVLPDGLPTETSDAKQTLISSTPETCQEKASLKEKPEALATAKQQDEPGAQVLEHSYNKDPSLEKSPHKSHSHRDHHKSKHKHSHHRKEGGSQSSSKSHSQSGSSSSKTHRSSSHSSSHSHSSSKINSVKTENTTETTAKSAVVKNGVDASTTNSLTSVKVENELVAQTLVNPTTTTSTASKSQTPVKHQSTHSSNSHSTPSKHHHSSSSSSSKHTGSKASSSSKTATPSSKHTGLTPSKSSSKVPEAAAAAATPAPSKPKDGSSSSHSGLASSTKKRKHEDQNSSSTPSSKAVKKLKLDSSAPTTPKKSQSGVGSTSSTPIKQQSSHKHSHDTPKKDGKHHSSSHSSSKKARFSTDYDYRTRKNVLSRSAFRYGNLMHIETHSNGGAQVLHGYMDELSHLSPERLQEFSRDFFRYAFHEEVQGKSRFVMGIIHGAACYLPDMIEHFAEEYPTMVIKAGVMGKPEVDSMPMSTFRETVHKTYSHGTYRAGPLLQVREQLPCFCVSFFLLTYQIRIFIYEHTPKVFLN